MRWSGIVTLVLLASGAQAQVRKVAAVVVAPEPGLEKEALLVGRALRARLAKDPRFELVDLEALGRGAAVGQAAERAKAARALFDRGVNSLDAVEYPAAVEQLGESVNAYLDADLTVNFPGLLDAIGMRAVALRQGGNSNAADDELSRLFTLSPSYQFAAGRWPPAVQRWIDRKQEVIRGIAPAGLAVASPAAAADVYVDGKFRGVTPVEVKELVPGRHMLTLKAPGYALLQLEVDAGVGAKASPVLEFAREGRELLSRLGNLAAGLTRGAPELAAQSLLTWSGAAELVTVTLELKDDEVWATATHLTGSGQAGVRKKSLGPGSKLALEDVGGLALALFEQSESAPGAQVKAVARGGGLRTLGLVIGGVGVAAGVGGVVAGLNAQAKAREARLTPQVDETAYSGAVASARGAAVAADGLYVLAAAGVGVGIVLVLTGGASATPGTVAVDVGLAPSGGWVSVGGAF